MLSDKQIFESLENKSHTWLVTGGAGFIGSHLVQTLLSHNQNVVSLDNLSTGKSANLDSVKTSIGDEKSKKLRSIIGTITNKKDCEDALDGVDFVLHQAALGSVPRSVLDPVSSTLANVVGFVELAQAAVKKNIRRFVYASSSSVYGDAQDSPKVEARTGNVLSPYAATKKSDELFAQAFANVSGKAFVGLRYFNVFGPRQDPEGEYAAVIPRWIGRLTEGKKCVVYGDGSTSRDFCYIENVVLANIRAALMPLTEKSPVFNIAAHASTSLLDLFQMIRREYDACSESPLSDELKSPEFADARVGDILHSLADISLAKSELGYNANVSVGEGIKKTVAWFVRKQK